MDTKKITARFIQYTQFDTTANSENAQCPSSPGQLWLGRYLTEELKALGLQDVAIDANGYVMATVPAQGPTEAPVIGFIAHLDTSPDVSGKNVTPRLIEGYAGGDIILSQDPSVVLSPREFPELLNYCGEDLLVTDGLTLLGADDKAGICAIVSAVEYLQANPHLHHPKLRLAFTPDEEIGRSAEKFDVAAFGADYAYTVDGGALGAIEYENFNAAKAVVKIQGRNVHPGAAKGKMINALTIVAEWQRLLPEKERPEHTEGYEGYFHVNKIAGSVEAAEMVILVRDHDKGLFIQRKELLRSLANMFNACYGEGTALLTVTDTYYNMKDEIQPVIHIVDEACQAMRSIGIEPVIQPIRGGTDGARLSFMGLPCPNLFAGGHNFHSRHEFLPVQSLLKATATVVEICCRAGRK